MSRKKQATQPDVLLSEAEAGALLGVSKYTIGRLRKTGDLSYVVVRHSIRIPTSELAAYQARQTVTAR